MYTLYIITTVEDTYCNSKNSCHKHYVLRKRQCFLCLGTVVIKLINKWKLVSFQGLNKFPSSFLTFKIYCL